MKTFIKLTQTGNDDLEGQPVWIDIEKIVSIEERDDRTQVSVSDDYFFVKESAREIFELAGEYYVLIRLCRGKEND